VKGDSDTAQPQTRMIVTLLSEFTRPESEAMGVWIKSGTIRNGVRCVGGTCGTHPETPNRAAADPGSPFSDDSQLPKHEGQ
jgi:hypothetical protein